MKIIGKTHYTYGVLYCRNTVEGFYCNKMLASATVYKVSKPLATKLDFRRENLEVIEGIFKCACGQTVTVNLEEKEQAVLQEIANTQN